MTRINTVPVGCLTDQHLMAEYRELPMVMGSLKRSLKSKNGVYGIPKAYTLNAGHVKFFYDKGKFLRRRYSELVEELLNRSYNINPEERDVDWDVFIANRLDNDWCPNYNDVIVNCLRIKERIKSKDGWYRYLGKSISYNDYVTMIDKQINEEFR